MSLGGRRTEVMPKAPIATINVITFSHHSIVTTAMGVQTLVATLLDALEQRNLFWSGTRHL